MVDIWTRHPLIEHNDFSRHDFGNTFFFTASSLRFTSVLKFYFVASLLLASKLVWTSSLSSPNQDRAVPITCILYDLMGSSWHRDYQSLIRSHSGQLYRLRAF